MMYGKRKYIKIWQAVIERADCRREEKSEPLRSVLLALFYRK